MASRRLFRRRSRWDLIVDNLHVIVTVVGLIAAVIAWGAISIGSEPARTQVAENDVQIVPPETPDTPLAIVQDEPQAPVAEPPKPEPPKPEPPKAKPPVVEPQPALGEAKPQPVAPELPPIEPPTPEIAEAPSLPPVATPPVAEPPIAEPPSPPIVRRADAPRPSTQRTTRVKPKPPAFTPTAVRSQRAVPRPKRVRPSAPPQRQRPRAPYQPWGLN